MRRSRNSFRSGSREQRVFSPAAAAALIDAWGVAYPTAQRALQGARKYLLGSSHSLEPLRRQSFVGFDLTCRASLN